MKPEDPYAQWAEDAEVFAAIGRELFQQPTRLTVRLPRQLADRALAAWEREGYEGNLSPETHAQRQTRHQAGTLGLIGLSIQQANATEDDEVVVELDAWYVGLALEASDERGLLKPPPRR